MDALCARSQVENTKTGKSPSWKKKKGNDRSKEETTNQFLCGKETEPF